MKGEELLNVKGVWDRDKVNISKMNIKNQRKLAKTVQTDLMREITQNLKNFTHITKEQWSLTIKKCKNYKKVFNLKNDKFVLFLATFLPLLGVLLGALFAYKDCSEAEAKTAFPAVKPINSDEFTNDPKKVIDSIKSNEDDAMSSSEIMKYCNQNQHKFSYYVNQIDKGNSRNNDKGNIDNCIISMCPPEDKTDIDVILKRGTNMDLPHGIIIEYDERYPHEYRVSEGQVISFCDDIGNINNIPVKARVRGLVTEVHENYFVVEYLEDLPEMDTDALIEQYQNTKMEEINDLFLQNMNITNYIKDYLLELRIPAIANHINLVGIPSELCIKLYRREIKNILEPYENRTKNNCSASNVQSYGKASKLHELKQILEDDKKNTFNQLINLYNNYKSIGVQSMGRIADFMLYDEYMEYLTDEEKFKYDDSNPYIVKHFRLLCKFLGIRSRLEKSLTDIPVLITKFNILCKKTLKKYWKGGNDYYADIKNIFQYEYYVNDPDQLIASVETDKNAVTLYSKVYDYLKVLTGYTPPEDKGIEYSENMDVQALLKNNTQQNTNNEMDSALKKIALNFCLVRNIETDANNDNNFQGLANQAIISAFYALDLSSGIIIEQYSDNYIGADPIIMAAQAILRPYLQTLKKVTMSEAYEMDKLGNEVIQWYEENGEKVNDRHIFDSFMEIGWGIESTIYRDNIPYNYTYLTYKDNDIDKALATVEPFDFENDIVDDSYYDSGTYLSSEAGPDEIKYWLRYLTMATIVNCMLPIYWGTGIIIAGVPVILPIIMIPFAVLPGRVTVVFGMGLCGICPMPLILFANLGNMLGSMLIPLNILADTLKKSLQQKFNIKKKDIMNTAYSPILKAMDDKIEKYNVQLDNLESEIHNLDANIKESKKMRKNIKKRKKEDPTTASHSK